MTLINVVFLCDFDNLKSYDIIDIVKDVLYNCFTNNFIN